MSTNVYLRMNDDRQELIGQFNFGSVFTFNSRKYKNMIAWRDSIKTFTEQGSIIIDEHFNILHMDEFWKFVKYTLTDKKRYTYLPKGYNDSGYDFSSDIK